jgi:uncharacterized membrane protein
VLFFFVGAPTYDSSMGFWEYLGLATLAGIIYSSVSFLLFLAFIFYQTTRTRSATKQKILASAWGLIITLAPFPILFGNQNANWPVEAELCACYLICIFAGIWLYRFPQKDQPA